MKPATKVEKAKASAEAAPNDEDAPATQPAGGDSERLRALEREVAQLKRKSAAAQALAQYAKGISAQEGDAGAAVPFIHPEDPVFELSVRSVLDKVDQERDDERRERRSERQRESVRRQTELLTERLKLNPSQIAQVEKILRERVERFRALREGDAGPRPVTRSEWRERMRSMQKETDDKFKEVLSESQLKDYEKYSEEEGFGPGRGGRRRGRP
ncbi:MAG TPA: hypothetical protein PKA88_33400 [Polyangiaceae bacterium]|nr:hypothetical protein [Polyangiaceae bacterium]